MDLWLFESPLDTVWRSWYLVMTSCRHSKGLFLPTEECLMRPRNKISKSCLWHKGSGSFSSTFCYFFPSLYLLLSLLCFSGAYPLCSPAVRLVLLQAWDCSAHSGLYSHSSCRKTLVLLLTPSQKPHPDDTKRQRLLLPWFVGGCQPHKQHIPWWGITTAPGECAQLPLSAPRTHHDSLPPPSRPTIS